MGRAINIGELLQSGLLGGAQLYNQQASRRQQGEIARRELDQRQIAMNDRAVQAEFEREQQLADAQRRLDQDAADGEALNAFRASLQPVMGPEQPGVPRPNWWDTIDPKVLSRMGPKGQSLVVRAMENADGLAKENQRQQGYHDYMMSKDVLQFATEKTIQAMEDAQIRFNPEKMPQWWKEKSAAYQSNRRDDFLRTLPIPEEQKVHYSAMDPFLFNERIAPVLVREMMQQQEAAARAQASQMTPEMLTAAVQNQMVLNPTWTPQQAQAFVMEREAGRVNQTDANIGSRGPDQTKALMDQLKVLDAVIAPYLDTIGGDGALKPNAPAKAKDAMRLREQIESRLMQSMGSTGGGGGQGMPGAGVVAPESTIVIDGRPMTIEALGGVEADRARAGRAKFEFSQIHGREPNTKDPADVKILQQIRNRLMSEEMPPR